MKNTHTHTNTDAAHISFINELIEDTHNAHTMYKTCINTHTDPMDKAAQLLAKIAIGLISITGLAIGILYGLTV